MLILLGVIISATVLTGICPIYLPLNLSARYLRLFLQCLVKLRDDLPRQKPAGAIVLF